MDRLNRLFGDPSEKLLKKLWPVVRTIRELEKTPAIATLLREDLPKKTSEFKERIQKGESLDSILPEAFAVACRACELLVGEKVQVGKQEFVWNMIPFDVQLLGGMVLHRGNISEMKTGEGKTLVCTLPVYLNALEGKGVHVVTVNDYLARRDSQWMGLLYNALGLTVGTIIHDLNHEERRKAYACDITYGTNNEFGFDYLRDNMASSVKHQVQRGLHYAIVDEVDSILVDEARTPLIISQPAEESTSKYMQYTSLVGQLQENTHFNKDEKQKTAVLTEEGIKKMEQLMGVENIYTEKGFEEVHHIEQALRAHAMYQRDVDYVVKDGEVIIVDEFTGRLMPGRRYSYGLHQAIEAKEGMEVQRESKTLATITFQNYFRLFPKLAGMTGTAKTEEEEFESIYRLRTIVVPTHRTMIRSDQPDAIYRSVQAKFKAVATFAKERHAKGQPVLIGTTSIEKSEVLSMLLEKEGIPHNVLNAKNHEKEAEIVARAGEPGAVTIATNMAGRGTDIKLGEGVAALGGLCILGTERHESRRIDNQLRGRSGRQGDPGESQFFVSMEDDLMRLFGGDRLKNMMERLNVPEDVPLQNRMVSRSIESAQKRVEGHHFDIRKHVLQYDNVMNKHREIIYKRRQKILVMIAEEEEKRENREAPHMEETGITLHQEILDAMKREVEELFTLHAPSIDNDTWNVKEICESIAALHPDFGKTVTEEYIRGFKERDDAIAEVTKTILSFFEEKCAGVPHETAAMAERVVTLRSIDTHWMNHIDEMSHLREQVAFAGYAQRDPVIEYQDQAFRKFRGLLKNIDANIVRMLLQIDFAQFAPRQMLQQAEAELQNISTNAGEIEGELTQTGVGGTAQAATGEMGGGVLARALGTQQQRQRVSPQQPTHAEKVGRNDPCPCGSGKKFKKCHGREA